MMMKGIRIALATLGCKVNQAETELLASQLVKAGYRLVSPNVAADIYILNTCTVTHTADRKSRQLLRQARRRNPQALVVATGCYAQRAHGELAHLGGIDLIIGNDEKPNLPQLLEEMGCLKRMTANGQDLLTQDGFKTRSFIKVQDGCHNFCSYCIVPQVRGEEKSLPHREIIAQVREKCRDGYKEVVITGVEVGSYSHGGIDLRGLVGHILAETGIKRLRLSSLQPQEISTELLRLWQDSRLCPHFHLALQSGSDSVLGLMNRQYSTREYREAVDLIRDMVPSSAITTDIIVGFPGETGAEFDESHEFCKEIGFARIHVFPYSPRAGTQAARMPDSVTPQVKKARTQKMLALARESTRKFNQKFLGKTMLVLWEKRSPEGIWSGLTPNYIKVYTENDKDLTNEIVPVKLVEIRDDGVWGIPSSPDF